MASKYPSIFTPSIIFEDISRIPTVTIQPKNSPFSLCDFHLPSKALKVICGFIPRKTRNPEQQRYQSRDYLSFIEVCCFFLGGGKGRTCRIILDTTTTTPKLRSINHLCKLKGTLSSLTTTHDLRSINHVCKLKGTLSSRPPPPMICVASTMCAS